MKYSFFYFSSSCYLNARRKQIFQQNLQTSSQLFVMISVFVVFHSRLYYFGIQIYIWTQNVQNPMNMLLLLLLLLKPIVSRTISQKFICFYLVWPAFCLNILVSMKEFWNVSYVSWAGCAKRLIHIAMYNYDSGKASGNENNSIYISVGEKHSFTQQ